VEVIVSTLIVGVMIVASLDGVGAVYRSQRTNAWRQIGPGLAHELMSEILSMPYEDPEDGGGSIGTETGESNSTRTDFDDVDDYDGWNSADAEDNSGVPLDGYTDWQRTVTVEWAELDDATVDLISDNGLKRITVTVTDTNSVRNPNGRSTVLIALRHKEGALQQAPPVDTKVVTWVGAELDIGNSPVVTRHGTQLTNHASDAN
jgi:hypothetical protein